MRFNWGRCSIWFWLEGRGAAHYLPSLCLWQGRDWLQIMWLKHNQRAVWLPVVTAAVHVRGSINVAVIGVTRFSPGIAIRTVLHRKPCSLSLIWKISFPSCYHRHAEKATEHKQELAFSQSLQWQIISWCISRQSESSFGILNTAWQKLSYLSKGTSTVCAEFQWGTVTLSCVLR